jgi:hypothetical protein
VTTAATAAAAAAAAAAGPGEFQYTSSKGFSYVLNTTWVTANEAQKRAEALGGTLVCWWVRWPDLTGFQPAAPGTRRRLLQPRSTRDMDWG